VPINQAKAILPQLLERGYVQRGYIGVALRDVDPDLQEALGLERAAGALVQDVTPGSPAERAGIRPYDLVTAVDGVEVLGNDELIREIASRAPGTTARLEVVRDGRARQVVVKLAERTPVRAAARRLTSEPSEQPAATRPQTLGPEDLGLTLIEITARNAHRFDLPPGMTGLLVQRVEPMSAAQDAGLERGHILLEVNRQPVSSVAALRALLAAAEPGHPLAVYVYVPEIEQRSIRTLRLDSR
jgi:S1-C subfamily serine protease